MPAIKLRLEPKEPVPTGASAPCGPECGFASPLGCDYVWCGLKGAPRAVMPHGAECRWYEPRVDRAASASAAR